LLTKSRVITPGIVSHHLNGLLREMNDYMLSAHNLVLNLLLTLEAHMERDNKENCCDDCRAALVNE